MVVEARSGRLLVVDADRESRERIASLLREAGYRVDVAATDADALLLAEDADFDLAVIDYEWPFEGRVDLFQRLRGQCPKMRGIFLTGSRSVYGTAVALSAGVDRVVDRSVMLGPGIWNLIANYG